MNTLDKKLSGGHGLLEEIAKVNMGGMLLALPLDCVSVHFLDLTQQPDNACLGNKQEGQGSPDRGFKNLSICLIKGCEPEMKFGCAEFDEVTVVQASFFAPGNTVDDD